MDKPDSSVRDSMAAEWDALARTSAMHYVDTSYAQGSTEWDSFYESGRVDALRLTKPAFEDLKFDPAGKTILEIGCGLGRLFPGFKEAGFAEIIGIDISKEMIGQAEEHCPVSARFVTGTGVDLSGIETASVDYCFSYIVFQHFPDKQTAWSYLAECNRVLKPGGSLQIQFRRPTLSWKFQAYAPGFVSSLLRRWHHGGDPMKTQDSWNGIAVKESEAVEVAVKAGISASAIHDTIHKTNDRFWLLGTKR